MGRPVLHQLELDLQGGPVPADPAQIVPVAVKLAVSEVSQGRAPGPAVVTLHGTKARFAKLIDVPNLHEVARGLVHEDKAEAVVLILPVDPPPGFEEAESAVGLAVEAADGRVDAVLLFRIADGDLQHRLLHCELPDQTFQWLDAGPEDAIGINIEGFVGMVGSPGDA